MTKSYNFYRQLLATMKRYNDCKIDLTEAGRQVTESHRWVYGKGYSKVQIVNWFQRDELRVFTLLALGSL